MKKTLFPILCAAAAAIISSSSYSALTSAELIALNATSVNFDYVKNGPQNLFDGKPSVWSTMPGAGNDEGVLMQFAKPLHITKIKYKSAAGGYAKVISCSIYADGVDQNIIVSSEQDNAVNISPSTLYFRIRTVEGYDTKASGSNWSVTTSQSGKSAAIEEIELYDGNGKMQIVSPRVVTGSVKASSTLSPIDAYTTDFLFDSRRDFGWAEGSSNSGEGEWLEFNFDKEQAVDRLMVWNGYQRSPEHYAANARVHNATVISGDQQQKISMNDSSSSQIVNFGKTITGKSFKLQIDTIYKGTKYKDMVISELSFGDKKGYFSLYTGGEETRKKSLVLKVKGTVLEKMIDRSFSNMEDNGPDGYNKKSIVLRSNGSFVLWIEESATEGMGGGFTESKVFDGNWDLISANGSQAKIKIFGKAVTTTENYDPYKTSEKSSRSAIFSDTVTVTEGEFKAAKSFDAIKLR